jgi:prepilin-type N-terminal cleavage/methylation domain-containing protein
MGIYFREFFFGMKQFLVRAFTLLEVLISLVIISLLVGVIFGIYASILRLSVRIEQEKNLNNELLFASQTIQNMVDNYDLNLGYYFSGSQTDVIDDKGYSDTLALMNKDKSIQLKKVGECGVGSGCYLGLIDGDVIKQLTNPFKVSVPVLQFRILPYRFGAVDDIYQKGFWVYGKMTSSRYNTGKYELNVAQDIQMFFDIRKY